MDAVKKCTRVCKFVTKNDVSNFFFDALHLSKTSNRVVFKSWISVFFLQRIGRSCRQGRFARCSWERVSIWNRFGNGKNFTAEAKIVFSCQKSILIFSTPFFFVKFSVPDEDRRNATEMYNPYSFNELVEKWPVSNLSHIIMKEFFPM